MIECQNGQKGSYNLLEIKGKQGKLQLNRGGDHLTHYRSFGYLYILLYIHTVVWVVYTFVYAHGGGANVALPWASIKIECSTHSHFKLDGNKFKMGFTCSALT